MRIDQREPRKLVHIDTEAHDRRNAAGACKHCDVAGRAAGGQNKRTAARPIDREETRRRQIDRRYDGAGWYRSLGRRSRQMREHTVANIVQVGRARAKILVVGRFVAGDFLLQRLEPRLIRSGARRDGSVSRFGEHIVLKQRNLEFQDCRRVLSRSLDEGTEIGECGTQRRTERLRFGFRCTRGHTRAGTVCNREQRAQRESRGGRSTGKSFFHHPCGS